MYEALEFLTINFPNTGIYIGGDFNCRIGELNQLNEGITSPFNEYISHKRNSDDKQVNARGKKLLNFMEDFGLLVLNGRTLSDNIATFTHLSRNGNSVIDLAWCNLPFLTLFLDFKICHIAIRSDHLPVLTALKIDNLSSDCKISKLKWKNYAAENYYFYMLHNNNIYVNSNSLDLVLNNFIDSIVKSAKIVSLISFPNNKKPKSLYNKPWFDIACIKLKDEVKNNLKVCKKRGFDSDNLNIYLNSKFTYTKICS